MKKIFFVLWAAVFISAVCFSGAAPASADTDGVKTPGRVRKPVAVTAPNFTGKVDSVSKGTGALSQMTIRDDKGAQSVFLIADDAVILDKDGGSISLNWIKGKKVYIEYFFPPQGGSRTARSIKVVPE